MTSENLTDLVWTTWNTTIQDANMTSSRMGANTILAAFFLRVIYLIIGIFGFFSNVFVVVVIALYKPMHKQLTNIFIVNQSTMDATVAMFLFFASLYEDDRRKRTPGNIADEAICRLWYTKLPLWGMLVASTYGILMMTLERFFAVVYPIWHKTTYTRNRILSALTMALPWVIGISFNTAYMVPTAMITPDGECTVYSVWPSKRAQAAVGVFTTFVQYLLPLALLAYGYSRMAWVLHKRVETVEGPAGAGGGAKETKRNESMARARSNVMKTLALVAFFFIFCWTWNQVYYLMYHVGYPYADFTSDFYNFTVVMVFVNCCVNPVIYSVKYEPFQRAVGYLFCRNKVRPKEEHGTGSNSTT